MARVSRAAAVAAGWVVLMSGNGCQGPPPRGDDPTSAHAAETHSDRPELVAVQRPAEWFHGGFWAVPGTTRMLVRSSRGPGDEHGQVTLWDYAKCEQGFQLTPAGKPWGRYAPVISPDGRWMLDGSIEVTLYDLRTRAKVRTFRKIHDHIMRMSFLADSRHFITTGNEGWVFTWDREAPYGPDDRISYMDAHAREDVRNEVRALAVSPDGTLALTGDSDGDAVLWRATPGLEVDDLVVHWFPRVKSTWKKPGGGGFSVHAATGRVHRPGAEVGGATIIDAAFFPDGRRVVVADSETLVRVFDVASGRELARHEKTDGDGLGVFAVAASPDGRHVLLASQPHAKLWDIGTGRVTELPGHQRAGVYHWGQTLDEPGGVHSVAFSPDGALAITGGEDGTVRLWRVPSQNESATADAPG